MIFDKQFQDIDWDDIELLIATEQSENENLDYKRDITGSKDADKKEFLADLCSFANGEGGYIIFGIEEKIEEGRNSGRPSNVKNVLNSGVEINRLEQIAVSGIAPRLPDLKIRVVSSPDKNDNIIIVKVSKSWIAPHMVSVEQVNKFWIRKQNSKFPMDYGEIKSSFILGSNVEESIRKFCSDREMFMNQQSTVRPIKNERSLMIHVVPLSTFGRKRGAISELKNDNSLLMPMSDDSVSTKINIDGFARYCVAQAVESYAQVFWDYSHEFVDSFILTSFECPNEVFIGRIGKAVCKATRIAFENLERLGATGPKAVILRINGIKNVKLVNSNSQFEIAREFDRSRIVISDVLELNNNYLRVTGQLMESVAYAAGYETARHVENGEWVLGE